MARIKFSSIVSSIDGSISGNTIQRNSYGSSIRNKPIPSRNSSVAQNTNRVFMTRVTQNWSGLSDGQRNAFNRFLSFSPDFAWNNPASKLSGYNLYLKWQYYILKSQGVFNDNIIFSQIIKPTIAPILVRSSGTFEFGLNPTSPDPNVFFQLRISPPAVASSSINQGRLKFIVFNAVDEFNISLASPYYDLFGILPNSGETVTVGITCISAINPIVFSEQLFNIVVS